VSAVTSDSAALSFDRLVTAIGQAHAELAGQASRAVNASLTLRNWLIGFYIAEYEQQGTDRARYADKLIERLSQRLIQAGVSRSEARELRRYRSFYLAYPQIRESLTPELRRGLHGLLPQAHPGGVRVPPAANFGVAASEILSKLSFTHIAELLQCDDATKRAFYELECIRGNWSVRELKRQMASLYYERSGLSTDKGLLRQICGRFRARVGVQGHERGRS